MDSNARIWTQPRSQAARSTKVKPAAFGIRLCEELCDLLRAMMELRALS